MQAIEQFVHKWEWFRAKAYCDRLVKRWGKWIKDCKPAWSRWSIGYGTKSYPWEIITREEADKRYIAFITPRYKALSHCWFSQNRIVWLISYQYNTGWYQMNLQKHIQNCNSKEIKYVMSKWGWSKNLYNRRQAELAKFNS